MKKRLLPSAALSLLLAVPAATASAAEPPSDSSVRAKESEVRQLKEELKAREAELEKLRHENEALRRERRRDRSSPSTLAAPGNPGAPAPATPPPQPSRPLPNVAAPGPDDSFEAADIAAWFAANPAEAAQKFVGREFVVRGVADRFVGVVLQRKFALELTPPGAEHRLRAIIGMPAEWNAVFAARNEESLVLRGERGNRTLLKRGDLVIFRARCEGVKGDDIRFDRGELIRKP